MAASANGVADGSSANGLDDNLDQTTTVRRERHNQLLPGICSPVMTLFDQSEDVDYLAIRKHVVRLAQAGLQGILTMGTNGEAVPLSREERSNVTKDAGAALEKAGISHIPVMVGPYAAPSSYRSKRRLEACEYVLLVPPSYYSTDPQWTRLP